jgi:peptidoglycan hydrolase CwlO-like protein
MALLNVSQAARVAGKSRKTIQTHIKSGRLSVARVEDGQKWIDPVEVERVYGGLVTPDTAPPSAKNTQDNAPQITQVFQAQIQRLEHEVQRLLDQISDLKEDRDEWREQAKKQSLLLHPTRIPKIGFWQWLKGTG